MLRTFARFWARLSYLWVLETEAHKNDFNAATAKRNAHDKRKLVEQLNADADAIEKNIKEVAEKEEKGYWLCENGHEKQVTCRCAGNFGEAIVHTEACPLPEGATKDGQPVGEPKTKVQCDCGKQMKYIRRDLMSGQEKYESDKERKDAEQMIAEKRGLATQEAKNVSDAEQVAQVLRGRAADSRAFADKIRQI